MTTITLDLSGISRDTAIITMVTEHGLTLNKATQTYAEMAKDQGITQSSKKADAAEYLAGQYEDEWDAKDVSDAIVELVDDLGVTASTARDYCKAHSEAMGWEHPSSSPREAMFEWLIANDGTDVPTMKKAFKAYAKKTLGRSESNINEYWKGYELHLALIAAK